MSVFSSALSCLNRDLKWQTLEPSACLSSWTNCVIVLEAWTDHVIALKSRTDLVIPLRSVLQLCVTAQFYLENNRKIQPWGMRASLRKDVERKEWVCTAGERDSPPTSPRPSPPPRRPSLPPPAPALDSSFYMLSLPLGLPCVNWASQERCLFYLRSGPWTFLCSVFMGFSLPCL